MCGARNVKAFTAVGVQRRGIKNGILQMSFMSNTFRKKSDGLPQWAALDQEALRIGAAMEHLQDHGNLDSFSGSQNGNGKIESGLMIVMAGGPRVGRPL